MALDLNDKPVRVPYQEFYGPNIEQMPLLIADKRVPLSVAGLMERRLNSSNVNWRDNYFDTGDAVAYKGDRVKIVLDAQPLRTLSSKSELHGGALVLTDRAYNALEGPEFTRKQLAEITGRDLTADEAKKHPVWKALTRGDDALLATYTGKMFEEMKKRFGYDDGMGVYLDSESDAPKLRAAYLDGLEGRSQLWGFFDLHYWGGRLVGVAPEAQSAPGKLD